MLPTTALVVKDGKGVRELMARHQRRSLHGHLVWLLEQLISVPEAVGSSPGVLPGVVNF
jgi:hypothetical protein